MPEEVTAELKTEEEEEWGVDKRRGAMRSQGKQDMGKKLLRQGKEWEEAGERWGPGVGNLATTQGVLIAL